VHIYVSWYVYIELNSHTNSPQVMCQCWTVHGYANTPFSPKFLKSFCSDGPVNPPTKFEVHSLTRSWDNIGYLKTLGNHWIRRSRASKVVDFGTNWKRLCDFLLVRHSNLGPILHHFGDIAGFLRFRVTAHLFHPNFGGVPITSVRPCWGQPAHRP